MKEKPDVILVTNREQRMATAVQIERGQKTMLAGGIRVQNAALKDLLPIRTYSEMLFPIPTPSLWQEQPEECGRTLAAPVLEMARRFHNGEGAFLFRVELRSKMDSSKKGAYIRKVSDALERASSGALINSVTDYELEIRLVLRRDGCWAAMLKLSALADERFAYRREVLASSIAPVNAALCAHLAKPWLKEGAQILDPFCGVGTMLIERTRAVPAGTMYGIDIFGEAIEKARRNTERAGCRIHYINRDFFTFEHEYLFDEIITNLPQVTASKPLPEIRKLYGDFFAAAGDYLKENAVLVLYATEPDLLKEAVRVSKGYRIVKQFLLNEKNHTSVFVLFYNK